MPPYEIDISVQDERWCVAIPEIEVLTCTAITKVLEQSEYSDRSVEVSIVLADDDFVQQLNKTYRHKDKPTNVLSFPQTEIDDINEQSLPLINLGDIIIAYETIAKESEEQNKTITDHYTHMLVHGGLHLLHYDHQTDGEAQIMETLEAAILNTMDIKNPYETQ
ncbi:MAG: rRNA maturation RNase YbeY [Alphaproteobacteria bacterium]|nr:MAG: rRNA maturation RNase YbeY [Alphaproteobacteria bacterium]